MWQTKRSFRSSKDAIVQIGEIKDKWDVIGSKEVYVGSLKHLSLCLIVNLTSARYNISCILVSCDILPLYLELPSLRQLDM